MRAIHTHKIRDEPVYYLFLVTLLVYFGYHYYLTLGFGVQASRLVPRIVIYLSTALIVLDLLLKTTVLGDIVDTHLSGDTQLEDRLMAQSDNTSEDASEAVFDEPQISKLLIEFGWVLSYCIAIVVIGFFTSTLAYLFIYLFVKTNNQSTLRRTLVAGVYSIALTAFLYILYIELLAVVSLFGLGVLI